MRVLWTKESGSISSRRDESSAVQFSVAELDGVPDGLSAIAISTGSRTIV